MTKTIVVVFNDWVSVEEIDNFLEDYNLEGTKTSSVNKKYVIEIPVREENKYKQIFKNNKFVQKVFWA